MSGASIGVASGVGRPQAQPLKPEERRRIKAILDRLSPAERERLRKRWQDMPPEQRRDAKNVNHTADIYALGKVLYEMVTGEIPDNVDPGVIPPPKKLSRVMPRRAE